MGRLIPLRRRRSTLYAVKETIAALSEELEFTLNYAEALSRDRQYRAVSEVIEEQRCSLVRATERMEEAVVAPQVARRHARIRVALAGVAAALAIASSAFAAFGPAAHSTVQNQRIEAINQASAALARANGISDPATLQAVIVSAQETILAVAQSAPTDPRLRNPLLASLANLQRFIQRNPNVPARVREQAKKVAETVQQIVVQSPDTSEQSSTPPPTTPATPPA